MAWRPVVGVDAASLKGWVGAAQLDEEQEPQSDGEWRELGALVDRWMRSPDGRAYAGAHDRPALWEVHLRGFEASDPEASSPRARQAAAALPPGAPPLAPSLAALADLHPWVAWMPTTNPAFPHDVVPRLFVRELGIFAHTQSHSPAWAWDRRLRDAGVDPLGDPAEQAPRALAVRQEGIERARVTG